MKQPLVSCIMPTANRQKYIPLAIQYFLNQDYPNKELIIVDDGKESIKPLLPEDERIRHFYTEKFSTIGAKRNFACQQAKGEIIIHMDDDDYFAKDWVTKQVTFLIENQVDICGIEHVHFFSPITDTLWLGTAANRNNPSGEPQWLNGATLAYWKSFWQQHPFEDKQTGEDDTFVKKTGARVFAHDYIDGCVVILHQHNTTTKYFEQQKHKSSKTQEI